MSYKDFLADRNLDTAGKITVITVLSGFLVFVMVFLFNVGKTEIDKVLAQSNNATTTLTVLNLPPVWIIQAFEETESSTSSPTNSGDVMTWTALADDANNAPYFLIVCAENVAPIASSAPDVGSLGTAPPRCADGVKQWGVSTSTVDETYAVVSTTTTETGFPNPFAERNEWYAWVCDDDPVNPECNFSATSTGISATNSAPFHMNRRPVFTAFSDTSGSLGADPGADITYNSTSSDPDSIGDTNGGADVLYLVVCNSQTYSTTTNTCDSGFIASTTVNTFLSDAQATQTLPSIIQDQDYPAYGYIVDEHGHEAVGGAQGTNATFTVANVAPYVLSSDISLLDTDGVGNLQLTVEQGETTGFQLTFTTNDANSCDSVIGGGLGDEVDDYIVSIYRTGIGTTTCDGTAGAYNPNNCYTSGYTPWNLVCTASTTTCTGATDIDMDWECTFPLWYITEATDAGPSSTDSWSAAIRAIDDDNATGTWASSSIKNDVQSLTALALDTFLIPYPALAPSQDSGTDNATTSTLNTGNTGIDQNLSGESMCPTFTGAVTCPNSATSTIPDNQQQFASTSFAYGAGQAMSSSTPTELEFNLAKSVSTSSPNSGLTYWGIAVPGTITLSGDYTGRNTYAAVTAEDADW